MPPGMTYLPVASMTVSTDAATSVPSRTLPGARTAWILSPSISTSAAARPVELTTVPPVMRVVAMVRSFALGLRLGDRRVRLGTTIAIELPVVAHLADHVHVEVAHDDLLV